MQAECISPPASGAAHSPPFRVRVRCAFTEDGGACGDKRKGRSFVLLFALFVVTEKKAAEARGLNGQFERAFTLLVS